jgi:hypothetical protein
MIKFLREMEGVFPSPTSYDFKNRGAVIPTMRISLKVWNIFWGLKNCEKLSVDAYIFKYRELFKMYIG